MSTSSVIGLISVINCIVLFLFSALAVTGDGSARFVYIVWAVGFPWIVAFSFLAFFLSGKGLRSQAIATSVSTLPAGYFAMILAARAFSLYQSFNPNSPDLVAACKDAGAHYIQAPSKAVESIAFDWDPKTSPPSINHFAMDRRGNISELRGGARRFAPAIKFTEGRCCQYEGRPLTGNGAYVRHPTDGAPYFGIPQLSADVLVTYRISRTASNDPRYFIQIVDMEVEDRRDNVQLATLRYAVDFNRRRGCGAVTDGVMDEDTFIARAIALQEKTLAHK